MRPRSQAALALAVLIAATPAALAQDYSLPASYGDVTLASGFAPEPYTADIVVRGELAASGVASIDSRVRHGSKSAGRIFMERD